MSKQHDNRNLIPNSERTPSELRKMTRNGGKKSGEVRRAKKLFRETCELLLSMDCKNGSLNEHMSEMGIPKGEQTNQMAITISMLKSALEGNVQAFKELRDTMGEKPVQRQEITGKDGRPLQERELSMKEAIEFAKKVNSQL